MNKQSLLLLSGLLLVSGFDKRPEANAAPGKEVSKASPEEKAIKVKSILGQEDGAYAVKVVGLYERANRTLNGAPYTEQEMKDLQNMREELYRTLKVSDKGKRQLAEMKERMATEEKKGEKKDLAEGKIWPQEAIGMVAAQLQSKDEGLSIYESKKRARNAYIYLFPYEDKLFSEPESRVIFPDGMPVCPQSDPKYAHFFGDIGRYWKDPVYIELTKLEAKDLPDAAMLPLCSLVRIGSIDRDDYDGVPVHTVLEKYGARLYPAIVEVCKNPETVGIKLPGQIDPFFYDLARKHCSVDQNKTLIRAALKAGWNGVIRPFRNSDFLEPILLEFEESPYGKPVNIKY